MNGYAKIYEAIKEETEKIAAARDDAVKWYNRSKTERIATTAVSCIEREGTAWARMMHHMAVREGLYRAADIILKTDIEVSEGACKAEL